MTLKQSADCFNSVKNGLITEKILKIKKSFNTIFKRLMLSKVRFNNLQAISERTNNSENSKIQNKFYEVFSKFNTF